ncbi:hypothetical protein ACJJTC_009562 [Scirpophaga incertulas]
MILIEPIRYPMFVAAISCAKNPGTGWSPRHLRSIPSNANPRSHLEKSNDYFGPWAVSSAYCRPWRCAREWDSDCSRCADLAETYRGPTRGRLQASVASGVSGPSSISGRSRDVRAGRVMAGGRATATGAA